MPRKGQHSLGTCWQALRTTASKDAHCFNGSFSLPFPPHISSRPRPSTPCGVECQVTFWPLISKSLSEPFALAHLKKPQLGPRGPEVGLGKPRHCSQLEVESPWCPNALLDQVLQRAICAPANPYSGAGGHPRWSPFESDTGKSASYLKRDQGY